jgi:hypothetical protein
LYGCVEKVVLLSNRGTERYVVVSGLQTGVKRFVDVLKDDKILLAGRVVRGIIIFEEMRGKGANYIIVSNSINCQSA